jgi:hypothetical protein
MEYKLEERDTIARLFLECRDNLKEPQLFPLRMEIMRNLIILCRRHLGTVGQQISSSPSVNSTASMPLPFTCCLRDPLEESQESCHSLAESNTQSVPISSVTRGLGLFGHSSWKKAASIITRLLIDF